MGILSGDGYKLPTRTYHIHQVRGYEIGQALGATSYPKYMKMYKQYPSQCEQAFSWVSDYPTEKSKEKLFFWKLWQIIKSQKNSQQKLPLE